MPTFEGGEVANDRHDAFTSCPFQLFAKEVARLGDFVENREGDITAEKPCRGGCLFFYERGSNPE